jgi:hypothetical protein
VAGVVDVWLRRAVLVAVALAATPSPVLAGTIGPDDSAGSTSVSAGSGVIGAGVVVSGGGVSGSSGGSGSGCVWRPATVADFPGLGESQVTGDGGIERVTAAGRPETGFIRECPDRAPVFVWVDTGPTVEELLVEAAVQVQRRVPVPVFDVSPAPQRGGIVYLGMWLAVQDPGPVSVTARVGDVFATVTATVASTRFEFGNGDVVECPGVGTPIVDPSVVEEGPCGYTYREISAPGEPYRLAATITWTVTYQTSSGSGALDSLTTSTAVAYPVGEIQTIGIAG